MCQNIQFFNLFYFTRANDLSVEQKRTHLKTTATRKIKTYLLIVKTFHNSSRLLRASDGMNWVYGTR